MKTVTITSIREETPGVKTLTITGEDGKTIPYVAGQFLTFVFTHHGREERRSFSLCSSPEPNEPAAFTVKRIDNGAYSRLLTDRASVGDKLYTTGAAGLFTLPDSLSRFNQVFFFAAGIGITPVFSLIKSLLHTQPGKQVVLIYSNRSREDVVFYNDLNTLSEKYPNFKIEFLYSTSFNLSRARLSKALLPLLLKEYATCGKEQILCYVCGPFAYMRMVIYSLEEQGIRDEQIRKENFNTNERVVMKLQPPDKDDHTVMLKIAGQSFNFPISFPDSILQAAKKAGVSLPYSCEVGRCGSCAAHCTSGKVWMSYNEVLMNKDIENGMVLTCVGHPVGGDIAIEI